MNISRGQLKPAYPMHSIHIDQPNTQLDNPGYHYLEVSVEHRPAVAIVVVVVVVVVGEDSIAVAVAADNTVVDLVLVAAVDYCYYYYCYCYYHNNLVFGHYYNLLRQDDLEVEQQDGYTTSLNK